MRRAVLRVRIPGNWIGDISSSCALSIKVLKCVPRENGGQSFLMIDGPPDMTGAAVAKKILDAEPACRVSLQGAGPGRHVGTVQNDKCGVCGLVSECGCFMDSAESAEEGAVLWNVIAPNAEALSKLVTKARRLGCEIDLQKVSVLRTASELTKEQERVLRLAFDLGYFDVPKRVNLEKLARRLEVSKATLDVMLRRAQRKILATQLQS